MPLDKMADSTEFAPTHKSAILHSNGWPLACIIDKNVKNASGLLSIPGDRKNLKASLVGFLNKHEDAGLLMGLKLKIQNDGEFFEYTVYPSDEFIDAVILGESICIINEKMESLFLLDKIITDQFVKTKSEFEKFKKSMRQQ